MVRLLEEWDVPEWDGDCEYCFYDEWEGPSGTGSPEVQTGERVGRLGWSKGFVALLAFRVVGERIV